MEEKDLAKEYQSQAQGFLLSTDEQNGRPYYENRTVQILSKEGVEVDYTKQVPQAHQTSGNLEQFSFNVYETEGRLFDVKQEIYRMPDRFIYNLGMIHGIQEDSSWETIDKLYVIGKISEEGAINLKKALSFATNLRLKTYSHYDCQKDTMDYTKTYDVQANEVEKELSTVFKLTHKDLEQGGALFEYYYTTLALRQKLKEFCKLDNSDQKEGFFNNNLFYQDDGGTKAEINLRLLRYEEALAYQLETLVILKSKYSKGEHPYIANSLNNIGYTYGELGNHNKALEYKTKALEIRQKSLGDDHPDVANSLNNIGYTYGELGNHNKALEYQTKALDIRQKSLGDDHPDVAQSLNHIGYTYGKLGNHKKALEYQKEVLAIRQKSLGNDHPYIANSLNNIGATYSDLGNHNKALEYIIKALEIWKKSLGDNHPDVATSYNNIGNTYGDLGDHNKALDYQVKALKIRQKSLSDDHPYIATNLNNIGATYRELGSYNKALEYLTKALEITQRSLGDDHPDVANSLSNIGSTYGALGNHSKALEYHTQALEIWKKSLDDDHPYIALSLNNIGSTYGALGNHNKALEYLTKALEITQRSLGADHPYIATSYNNVGIAYGKLGDHSKALEYLTKALEIWKKSLSYEHPDIATSLNNIGYTYGDLGDHEKALEYWTKALEIWKKSLGEDHPYVATSLNEKIEILSSEGTNAYKKQNYGEAIEKYNLAIKLIDKILSYDANSINTKASLYYNIARSYHNDNNLEQALINYNNTYQLNDKHDKARDYFYKCATDYAKNDKAIVTEESANITVSGENILKTLDLLIRLQTNLCDNSQKDETAIRKQLNLYIEEYDDLKKSMDDKQLKLQEIEEFLVAQEQARDKQVYIQLADNTLAVIENSSSAKDMPEKDDLVSLTGTLTEENNDYII
jgi:tetratricopeptide (TPR) repeat protein